MSGMGEATFAVSTENEETARARCNGNDTGASYDNGRTKNNPTRNWRKEKNCGGKGGGKIATSFCGKSTDMSGHVFQTYAELNKRGQFQNMLNMLKVYASNAFKEDTDSHINQ